MCQPSDSYFEAGHSMGSLNEGGPGSPSQDPRPVAGAMPRALGSARPLAQMGDYACPDLPLRTLEGYTPGKETWTLLPTNALWCAGIHLHEVPIYLPARKQCLVVETP